MRTCWVKQLWSLTGLDCSPRRTDLREERKTLLVPLWALFMLLCYFSCPSDLEDLLSVFPWLSCKCLLNLSRVFVHPSIYQHSAQRLPSNIFYIVLCQICVDDKENVSVPIQADLITKKLLPLPPAPPPHNTHSYKAAPIKETVQCHKSILRREF